jgi:hypothetical protein
VAGTGAVKLGMSEDEVGRALGGAPERRKEAEQTVEAVWRLEGAVPGSAVARFVGGPLVWIEFSAARPDVPPLPRVTRAAAEALSNGALARKAIQHVLRASDPALTMDDVLAAAGGTGRRVVWRLFRSEAEGAPESAASSVWAWEVEPGGKVLLVDETSGEARQPTIRDLPRSNP